jgi:hypothetical protein
MIEHGGNRMEKIKQDALNFEQLTELGIENLEIALDRFLDDTIVKEIPILKSVIALVKTGKSIKDYLFMKKILAFLTNIQDIPKEKVDTFIQENKDKTKEIGMSILLIIESLNEISKAELIGKLFRLVVEKEIDDTIYLKLCYIIDKCYFEDILALKYFKECQIITSKNSFVHTEVLEGLYSNGLLSNSGFDGGDFSGKNSGTRFNLNRYSSILIRLI